MSEDVDERIARLERRAQRERDARGEAERLLKEKSLELYRANQTLARFTADLERRVEERTRELDVARERAIEIANQDQLTGLANRACFVRSLDDSIRKAGADGGRFALFMMDLDRFKEINDTLGHEAGDVFLKRVARRLRIAAGGRATVARLGGDEFAVIAPAHGGYGGWTALALGLADVVRRPVSYRGHKLETTGSVGIAVYPQDAGDARDLQRYADLALYRSKATRATHTFYDAEMGRELDERHALGGELAGAIRSGDVEAWFQPVVDGASQEVVSVEALARWNHPVRGLVRPAVFLGLAEERGLMGELFEAMMRSACPPARRWIAAGLARSLSVNVSPSQFKLGRVADEVTRLLAELDFPPDALTIEITEEVLMNDLDRAREQLTRIEALGVRIALDDFGVGYSNIGYLRQLPVHTIKLDRSLSADLLSEPKARSVVGVIVDLARALDLDLIAEGVEDEAQALWLAQVGCRRLQGYLFGKPMTADVFEREFVLPGLLAPSLRKGASEIEPPRLSA
jgi:diguanylate cyclase (GGDEF)-like protein